MESPYLKFRLPPEVLEKIKALSVESGLTVSDILRACVTRALPYVEQKARECQQ